MYIDGKQHTIGVLEVDMWDVILASMGGIISFGVLVAGSGYAYGKFKQGTGDVEKETQGMQVRLETLYKETLDAQNKRFEALEKEHKENVAKISKLEGVVQEQNKQRKWFEGIFLVALENYFSSNPQIASELKDKLESISN